LVTCDKCHGKKFLADALPCPKCEGAGQLWVPDPKPERDMLLRIAFLIVAIAAAAIAWLLFKF
jgi:hypothetical protein